MATAMHIKKDCRKDIRLDEEIAVVSGMVRRLGSCISSGCSTEVVWVPSAPGVSNGKGSIDAKVVNDGEGAGVSLSLFKGCRVSSKNSGTKNGAKVGNLCVGTDAGTGKPRTTGVGAGVLASTRQSTDRVEERRPFPPQMMASKLVRQSSGETSP